MGNRGSSGRTDWRVLVAGGVGAAVGMAFSGLVLTLAEINGFWPGVVGAGTGAGGGVFLGQILGARIFSRPPGQGPADS